MGIHHPCCDGALWSVMERYGAYLNVVYAFVFLVQFFNKNTFLSFNNLLNTFRHLSKPYISMLSGFKKLLLSDLKLQMSD